jgi:hypothetical protein
MSDKKTSSSGNSKEEETVVEFDIPKHLTDTNEYLKQIFVLLDKLDDKNVFKTKWEEDMSEIKVLVEKINDSGIENSWEENLAHKPIEMVTSGGRGGRYVDVWRLIGPNESSIGVGQISFFRNDKGNLVQTMPKKPYIGDGNDYSPPRFHSYRTFISQLINNIDATIEALVEEHLKFAPGGKGAEDAEKEFKATRKKDGGRRKRKTKRRKRKTKRRKTRGKRKTKRKRKRRKHRRKSKHTKR